MTGSRFTISVCLLLAANSLHAETETPSFGRHVVPVLSRLGCNGGGACHGTVKGQNGFRLSLFGALPKLDHDRITRELSARRVNFAIPEQSLILLKATGQAPHGGGKRTSVGSSDYNVLRDWLAAGAPLDDLAKAAVTQLTVTPTELNLKAGQTGRFQVRATYVDGNSADVTHLCKFETPSDESASVDHHGTVNAKRVGDGVVVIRYGAEPILAMVLVAPTESKKIFVERKPHNFIDVQILAKQRALDLVAAPLCDDETFLRRATLDVTGLLPAPDEVRAFLADKSADKRQKKIDELLARPGYGDLWAAKFSDIIKPVERGNDGGNLLVPGQILRIRFFEWLKARLQENVPYDQLVERIFVSSSLEGRPLEAWIADLEGQREELANKKRGALGEPLLAAYNQRKTLDLYWERDGAAGITGAMQFSHAFLGLRLQCANCHRHPYDVWQQDDLLSFAHFFTAMNTVGTRKNTPEVEEYIKKKRPEAIAWTEEIKKLAASKILEDKTKLANLQAKLATWDLIVKTEVAPVKTAALATINVKNPLGVQESRTPRLLGVKEIAKLAVDGDRRVQVMDWLRQPDHPFFAKSIVNRVWAHYFGRGLIDPPDNLSPLNPPSHPQLLDELRIGFVKNGYDLRWLHRTILQSRTYQQSSLEASGRSDPRYYTRFEVRRLPGEVILDALNEATGAKEKFTGVWMFREGERAVFVAGVMVDVYNFYTIKDPMRYLVFGRQVRRVSVQCDCEQGKDVALPQLLYLANHDEVQKKIAADKGRVATLAGDGKLDNAQRVETLFLHTLGRLPAQDEKNAALEHLKGAMTLRLGLEEVLWSLLNTREFQLNY